LTVPAAADEVYVRDVSESPADESKRITIADLRTWAGTQEASVVANELDDYEEGVFTPGVIGNSGDGASASQAYGTNGQVGRYQKIGNRVYISIYIELTSLGSLTTSQGMRIVGLPIPSANVTNVFHSFSVGQAEALAIVATGTVAVKMNANESVLRVELWDDTGGTTNLLLSEFSADGNIKISGFYEVAT
jgi:hypothetical protein